MPDVSSFDPKKLSPRWAVRPMEDADAEDILTLCRGNPLFYRYSGKQPTKAEILNDLRITPPGVELSAKYYVGFFDWVVLVAVMDLIVGYPEEDACFIGFFMMNRQRQGASVGSGIVQDVCRYLTELGFKAVGLGINKGNPQSTHFWKKNGFQILREVERPDGPILLAERKL